MTTALRVTFLLGNLLLTTAASAQQQHQQTPSEQALGTKLLQEIQGSLTCNASLISVQSDLAKAQARLKELEPKPAPEK
jgi:hypothetical protein